MMAETEEPIKTPIFTPPKLLEESTKAKLPINRLMVNPIPVKTPTP